MFINYSTCLHGPRTTTVVYEQSPPPHSPKKKGKNRNCCQPTVEDMELFMITKKTNLSSNPNSP